MFFNWFRKKRQANRKSDLVWVSQSGKYQGIGELIKKRLEQGAIVAIAHFPEAMISMTEVFESLEIPYQMFSYVYERLAVRAKLLQPRTGEVSLVLAEILPEPFANDPSDLDSRLKVYLVAIEHYPVASKDQRIISLANSLPFPTELEFHAALDEPLLKIFGGDRILEMISQFRLSEDMPLESGTLTRSLESARVKLSKNIKTDIAASSLSEWFRVNTP